MATLHSSSANSLASVHTAWTTFITSFFSATFNALMSTSQSVNATVTDQLDPVSGKNVAQTSSGITEVGTGGGATPSPRNCMVISLTSALPTRAGRGRMYLPSPDSSHYAADGSFLTAAQTAVSTSFASHMTTLKATTTPVIYHRATKTSDNIVSIKVGIIVGTQRRRTNRDSQSYAQNNI